MLCFWKKCKKCSVKNQPKKENIMPPKLIALIENLQTLTQQIAEIVLASGGPVTAPQNVKDAYAGLQAASAQLASDMTASPFVLETVRADAVALQQAVTALGAALANPSTP